MQDLQKKNQVRSIFWTETSRTMAAFTKKSEQKAKFFSVLHPDWSIYEELILKFNMRNGRTFVIHFYL